MATDRASEQLRVGDRVRDVANGAEVGEVESVTAGPGRMRAWVQFASGRRQVLLSNLERAISEVTQPDERIRRGMFDGPERLREAITHHRLSGKLGDLIYSLNTTRTKFLAYQFKPVLQFLESPCNGILIADEVGLGKTIEAGLIWTELRARDDARRLLVLCPAMLKTKWRHELSYRFGVKADLIDDAGQLQERLEEARQDRSHGFALVASLQGMRPTTGWDSTGDPSDAPSARLARYLNALGTEGLANDVLDLVVIDEAHYLKNDQTASYKLAQLIRPLTKGLVLMTATPLHQKNRDLFNLLRLLDANTFSSEWAFEQMLMANEPLVALRDQVRSKVLTQAEFLAELDRALAWRMFNDSQQIQFLRERPPTADELADPRMRARLADRLDRINPQAKVVTRTMKRHQLDRVERDPSMISASLEGIEKQFYQQVTATVRHFCLENDRPEGFILSVPQRQMTSCMAAAAMAWEAKAEEDEDDTPEGLDLEDFSHLPPRARRRAEALQAARLSRRAEEEERRRLRRELRQALVTIARQVGGSSALAAVDAKYAALRTGLVEYWAAQPDRKVILFAFFKGTLRYLHERLSQDGIRSVVLHGEMEKQEVLQAFESSEGAGVLLSSEVAAEGVDLQFANLLVNYDLPWNPARIEQRVGRIDRIGQEAKRIRIWNLVYANSLDERVYRGLIDALGLFQRALGSAEAILGEEITALTRDLLTDELSPAMEAERIERARMAIESKRLTEEQLEAGAAQLIGNSDFILNKVEDARTMQRYIRGQDLLAYVQDALLQTYPGTLFIENEDDRAKVDLRLTPQARAELEEFLQQTRLGGQTRVHDGRWIPARLIFDNQHGQAPAGFEKITQDHPLVRFATHCRARGPSKPLPTVAVEVPSGLLEGRVPTGMYALSVANWSFQGARTTERLCYAVRSLETGLALQDDDAEWLVNLTAIHGQVWPGSQFAFDGAVAASLHLDAAGEIDDRYEDAKGAFERENVDRVQGMLAAIEQDYQRKRARIAESIEQLRASPDAKQRQAVPLQVKALKDLDEAHEQRKYKIDSKRLPRSHIEWVAAGVIRVR